MTMNFLKKILGGSTARSARHEYTFSVKCSRCGEVIEGHVDLNNDLSGEYSGGGDIYHARKILIGENHCFQRMEVELKFSSARELIERQVTGGEFI
jgi:hypothetical protein